jgi:hypothetical protein
MPTAIRSCTPPTAVTGYIQSDGTPRAVGQSGTETNNGLICQHCGATVATVAAADGGIA